MTEGYKKYPHSNYAAMRMFPCFRESERSQISRRHTVAVDPKAQVQAAQEAASRARAAAKEAAVAAAKAEAKAEAQVASSGDSGGAQPLTVNVAGLAPTVAVPLDVFTQRMSPVAEATERSTVDERAARELTPDQRRMADAAGAGRMTAEELRALADEQPGDTAGDDSALAGTTIADIAGHDNTGRAPGASAAQFRETMESLEETNSQNQGRLDTSAVLSGSFPSIGGTSREDVLDGIYGGGRQTGGAQNPGFGKHSISDGANADPNLARILAEVAAEQAKNRPDAGTPDGGTPDGGTPDGGPGEKKGAAWDDEEGLTAGSTDFATEYPKLSKFLKFFTGDGVVKGDALDQAVDVIDAEGKPAPAADAGTPDAGTQTQPKPSQPADPDAPTPDEILRWQAYLAANGLLNLNNPNAIENKSNPSPEGSGGGGPKSAGEIWREQQTNQSMVGQPTEGDGTGGGGKGPGTNWNSQRIGAVDPGFDQNPEYEKGPEDSEAVNLDPNANDLSGVDYYAGDDDDGDQSRYPTLLITTRRGGDDHDDDGGRGD